MSNTMIATPVEGRQVRAWLRSYSGRVGGALDAAGTKLTVGGTDGQTFTVSLLNGPATRALIAALDGSRVWSLTASKDTVRIAGILDEPVEDFDWLCCASTLAMVLDPAAEVARKKSVKAASVAGTGRHPVASRAAVRTAERVEELAAGNSKALRQLALRSVRMDALHRTQMARGWALDEELLGKFHSESWAVKTAMTAELGIDLTADTAEVVAWIESRGVTLVRKEGAPSLSRDDFDMAVIPDGAPQEAWATFRKARSLKSMLAKVSELIRASNGGRVYGSIVTHHTKTGRGTVQHLHNLSRLQRPLMVADAGFELVSLDLSQCEVRIAAALSGDPQLIADLARDGDLYLELAVDFYGESAREDKAARAQFKKVLIAGLYGQGITSLAAELGVSVAEAEAVKASLRSSYPRLAAWIAENTAAARAGGSLATISGRPLPAPEEQKFFKATNSRVQGSGADLLYEGIERVVGRLGRGAFVLSIHDEVVVRCRPADVDRVMEVLEEEMTCELPGGVTLSGTAQSLGRALGK